MPQSPTTNMLLVQPSENGDAGTWDTLLTAVFALIDAHDHSSGKGVTVKSNGISINADLAFSSGGNFFVAKDLKAVDFNPTAASGMTSYSSALFANSSDSNNLYFRNSAGTNVRITNGSSLDITSSGGFGGDYISVAAEAAYSDSSKEYTFKGKDPDNFWAAVRSGPLRVAQIDTTESVYTEIAVAAGLAGSYTLTLPTALPASGSGGYLHLSAAGQLSTGDRVITVLPAFSGNKTSTNIGYAAGAAPNYVTPTAGSETWVVPVPLSVGDRIKSITWHYQRLGGTLTFALRKTIIATNVDSSVANSTDNSTSGYTSITTSSINYTLVSTEQSYLHWTTGANGDRWHYAVITYDHP